MKKLIAFDLDGTLTQHKTKLIEKNKKILDRLSEKYKLLMVGAGSCRRIFVQMNFYPIDIIGNYGLQYAKYNPNTKEIDIVKNITVDCDRDAINKKAELIRKKHGFTEYAGNSVEFHKSGCVTFAILGTAAAAGDKLKFDPDRSKRRKIYRDVCESFNEYEVFVGGLSSFDMAPIPHNKYNALDSYCKENGISHNEVVFVGDDYGLGGNDEPLYKSDFDFVRVDNFEKLGKYLEDSGLVTDLSQQRR